MAAPFRWAIAGYGWVARDHMAPGLAQAGHTLLAVADPSEEARHAASQRGARAYDSVEALLRAERPDALYAATPNHLHLAPVLAAAQAGIPVLCEKPMAATMRDAEDIGEAVRRRVVYGTAFDQRHHPAHVALRRALTDGIIGDVTALRIVYACWVGPSWSPNGVPCGANWRADPGQAGGGAVMDLAPHGLDLAAFLLDEPLTELSIVLQRRVHDYAVEDGGMLTGRTRSGILFSQHVAYNCPETLPRRRLEVIGTRGQITAANTMGQARGGTLALRRDGRLQGLPFDTATSPFAAQAAAFADAVRGASHDFSAARDLALHRLFDGAYAKARACL